MEDSTLAIWEPGMQSPERETSAGMGSIQSLSKARELRPRARKGPYCKVSCGVVSRVKCENLRRHLDVLAKLGVLSLHPLP